MLSRLFPELCPGCRGPTSAGFCSPCRAELARVADACPGCGLPKPVRHCPRLQTHWRLEHVLAPYDYAFPMDRHIVALKFQGARRLGRALGLLLAEDARRLPAERRIDGLVPVPLHGARLRERGYNQSFEIARAVAAELSVPLLVAGVRRPRATAPQSGPNAAERYRNVRDAFDVRADVAGRRLAVVDDVITTGATANALAARLSQAGAAAVDAWAVARTV
jgi:ComF family protein